MLLSRFSSRRHARRLLTHVASFAALASPAHASASEQEAPAAPADLDAAQRDRAGDATTDAAAHARDEAARHFESARALYAEGDYQAAAVELERAYELVPDPRVLYKLGKLRLFLQHHARARRAFEKYLAESGAGLSPESRQEVVSHLEVLREKTARLELNVNVSGAEVLVDDEAFGHSPLPAPLVLDTGERRIVLRKPGFATHESRLTLAGNEVRRLDAALEPEATQPARTSVAPAKLPSAPLPPRPAEPATTGNPTLTWVAWSATGALALGTATAGVLGLVAVNELDTLKEDPNASREALERRADRAEIRLLTADILAGATLLAAGGALYFTFSGPSQEGSPQAVSLKVSPGGVTLAKRF